MFVNYLNQSKTKLLKESGNHFKKYMMKVIFRAEIDLEWTIFRVDVLPLLLLLLILLHTCQNT